MEDHAVVPERVFDAACGGGVAEVEEWLTSAAASRDVDHNVPGHDSLGRSSDEQPRRAPERADLPGTRVLVRLSQPSLAVAGSPQGRPLVLAP